MNLVANERVDIMRPTRQKRKHSDLLFTRTTMSDSHLLPEIFDYIVDHLQDDPKTLQNCCLVAKSWVPRSRKNIFTHIRFSSPKVLESWKKTFPNPSNSPAYHTRILSLSCAQVITPEDAEEGGWIRAFSNVVRLNLDGSKWDTNGSEVSLAPLHGLSPVLKTLRVISSLLPTSQIFDLICSLPLLEDLLLLVYGAHHSDDLDVGGTPAVVRPSTSPPLTGTFEYIVFNGVEPTARRLLDLPNGLHFRYLMLQWRGEDDLPWINALVVRCSDTLQSLGLICHLSGTTAKLLCWNQYLTSSTVDLGRTSIDLSKAERLKSIAFACVKLDPHWIAAALETITPGHRDLQEISIHMPYNAALDRDGVDIRQMIGETVYGQWLDVDRLLVQFWDSRSIRPRVMDSLMENRKSGMGDWLSGDLLPEITGRGIIDLVEQSRGSYPELK